MQLGAVLVVITTLLVIALLIWAIVYLRIEARRLRADASPIKPAWSYLSWRVGVPVAYAIFAAGFAYAFVERSVTAFFVVNFMLWPFLLVTVVAVATAETFGFDYSVFGRYRRTSFPDEIPLHQMPFSYAIIGKVGSGPTVTWLLYRGGVGIRVAVIGDVFLPLEEIEAIDIRGRAWGMMSEMTHHCPEVRSPIGVPNKVAAIMGRYYPEKVLVPTEMA